MQRHIYIYIYINTHGAKSIISVTTNLWECVCVCVSPRGPRDKVSVGAASETGGKLSGKQLHGGWGEMKH